MATSAAKQEVLDKLALRKLPAPQTSEEKDGTVTCTWKDGKVSLTRNVTGGCTWSIDGTVGNSKSLAEAQDALTPALAKAEPAKAEKAAATKAKEPAKAEPAKEPARQSLKGPDPAKPVESEPTPEVHTFGVNDPPATLHDGPTPSFTPADPRRFR